MENKRDEKTYYVVDSKNSLVFGETAPQSLLHIKTSKEDFKRDYTLRGRIGIHILRIIGVATLEITNK